MPALWKLWILFIWLVGVPVVFGVLPCLILPAEKRSFAKVFLAGYLLQFALFELCAIPVLLFTYLGDFSLLSLVFEALCALWCFGTVFVLVKRRERLFAPGGLREEKDRAALVLWTGFALLVLFQLYMAYTRASFDGDDAYYVTQSVLTWQTGTMYRYLPYTGITTSVDFRHALAMLPMWTAHAARVSQTHPAIVAHSMEPLVFIPLTYLVYLEVARALFCVPRERTLSDRRLPVFLLTVAMLVLFGNVSIHTPETFLLTRTWQGKSLLANLILPCGLLGLLWLGRAATDAQRRFARLFLTILSAASGLLTSMAPALLLAMVWGGALLLALTGKKEERAPLLRDAVLTTLPCLFYLALFFLLR